MAVTVVVRVPDDVALVRQVRVGLRAGGICRGALGSPSKPGEGLVIPAGIRMHPSGGAAVGGLDLFRTGGGRQAQHVERVVFDHGSTVPWDGGANQPNDSGSLVAPRRLALVVVRARRVGATTAELLRTPWRTTTVGHLLLFAAACRDNNCRVASDPWSHRSGWALVVVRRGVSRQQLPSCFGSLVAPQRLGTCCDPARRVVGRMSPGCPPLRCELSRPAQGLAGSRKPGHSYTRH